MGKKELDELFMYEWWVVFGIGLTLAFGGFVYLIESGKQYCLPTVDVCGWYTSAGNWLFFSLLILIFILVFWRVQDE